MKIKNSECVAKQLPLELGVIRSGELYTLAAAKARLGIKDAALRSARRSGLPVLRYGGRAFIRGDDLIAFLMRAGIQGRGCLLPEKP